MTGAPVTWKTWLQQQQAEELIAIPTALGQSPWQPSGDDRRAAWVLFTEIRTRIATQPLHYRTGDEETALDSLHKLFAITRDAIKHGGPDGHHFATLATIVLNTHIRPLTARWHKKKIGGRLLNDDERREFRRALNELREKLVVFCRLLDNLSAKDGTYQDDGTCGPAGQGGGPGGLGGPVPFDGKNLDSELHKAEEGAIKARRGEKDQGKVNDLAGLACSGGGIRSATFCLGVVQAIARRGTILPDVDYLSTVSGGGYLGAFLSSYLNDADHTNVGLGAGQLPFAQAGGAVEPDPIRMLRNNSKYLLKGGLLGQTRMAGLMLFGILVNLLALLPFLLIALIIAKVIAQVDMDGQIVDTAAQTILYGLLGVLGLTVFGLPFVYRWCPPKGKCVVRYERSAIGVGLTTLAVWALGWLFPWVYLGLRETTGSPGAVLGVFAVLPFLLAGAAFAFGSARLTGRVLVVLTGIAGPLFIVMAWYVLDDLIPASRDNVVILLLASVVLLIWLFMINVNQISPHRYYRNRLAETYLLRRTATGSTETVDPQLLSKLRSANPATPYHLINAAVNLPGSRQPELRGRNADFFLFTQHFCGSPLLGYCPTEVMEAKDGVLDLGTAMAISGAAASSFMGTKTVRGLAFWLSLLNVRLAYWLPNPRHIANVAKGAAMSPFSLWSELLGRLDENGRFVNLSDGGHIENLGIHELLRRKCRFIVAIDAEADPGMTFPSLMQLIRFAEIDFGIRIRIDLGDLRRNAAGFTRAHFALGEIGYGANQMGYLLYIKSSLTGNERDYVLDYRHRNPAFPHETTADQFFSEAQFEAYRALGEHIGEELFAPELIAGTKPLNLENWFAGLARNLL